jgi:hypothetical protein
MNINLNTKNIFSPKNLISAFTKVCSLFSLGEQSDSQRFYRNLAIILEKELGDSNTCIKDTFIGEFIHTMNFSCSCCFCEGEETNIVNQRFFDLLIKAKDKASGIIELLNETYRKQNIISSKKCQKFNCNYNLVLTKSSKIRPNKYLSVNIQKGNISNRLLNNNSVIIDNLFINGNLYEPYGLNIHSGTMDYGHYYR